uniref:CNH domain-containing protein n=1 Tax=Macrostomum lignano TaxID=282301 RepID=A0A1I8GER2_9PLAT
GFSPAGRANANARANGYCRDSQLAVLVAGPAGGGLHAVVSLADAGTTLASVDATPLAFIRLTDGERVSATAAHVCGECGRVQVLLLTSLNRLLLWSLPPQPRPSPNASTQWCQSQPQPPVLQVPDAAATLHSDAGDLFRRNRLISVGPTRLANQRQFYYAALTRRESLVTVVEVGCRSIRLTDRLTWQRPLKGFLRWSRPAVAAATECRQLVTMAIKAHVGLSERRSSLLVVRHRVLDGGDHQAGKLVMEESFEYERTFQSEDILLCGYGAKSLRHFGHLRLGGTGPRPAQARLAQAAVSHRAVQPAPDGAAGAALRAPAGALGRAKLV